jgi:SAM-dependent methyltransferase
VISLERSPLGREALDDPDCPAPLAQVMLQEIARANAWFGGRAAACYGASQLLDRVAAGGSRTLLDVGAGSGDIALRLVRQARRRGIRLTAVACDTLRAAAILARRHRALPVVADAAALPIGDAGVDIVLASQFLHHFDRRSAVALLRDFDRVARLGVVICEPRRTPLAVAGIWIGAQALGFHETTRRDGVLSVRRSFTAAELATLLDAAGVRGTVRRRPGFRLVAWWLSGHAHH